MEDIDFNAISIEGYNYCPIHHHEIDYELVREIKPKCIEKRNGCGNCPCCVYISEIKMEKKLVRKPERLDDLPKVDEFIYYMNINHSIFKNRTMKIFDWTKGIDVLDAEVPIPGDHIICDICNWNIALDKPEKIPLLCELGINIGKTTVKKALCQKCVDKYYPKLICIGKPKGSE